MYTHLLFDKSESALPWGWSGPINSQLRTGKEVKNQKSFWNHSTSDPISPSVSSSKCWQGWDMGNFSSQSVQFSSVTQLCLTLCNPMDCSMPGLPVHHQLPGFTQTHVHWVGNTIQPPHSLLSPSLPAFNLSQHQGLFQWAALRMRWPKFQLQHQSFQWIFRTNFL